ncbi:hypothetical protein EJ02DRAFT_470824 [Clathrospora elynae]|uniref:Uncharacterized protein n=1 Tax=Clathrospora elynae TaxID=706981 RepID=A0A6A5SET5_9PLEO|nr:hypothetical protein EJ02DRAFT_470824 [Clathrospora elynae]
MPQHPRLLRLPQKRTLRLLFLVAIGTTLCQIHWLYTELNEITLQSAPPAWTRDGWVFTPMDLQELSLRNSSTIDSSANVSFSTTALRGRLECNPLQLPNSTWTNAIERVHRDRIHNITGRLLPTLFDDIGPYALNNIPVFSALRQMAFCANKTEGQQSVVAYWSSNNTYIDSRQPYPEESNTSAWIRSFTIKWIAGSSAKTVEVSGQQDLSTSSSVLMADESRPGGNVTLLYWEEQPDIQIMSCEPIIEFAQAEVTVARTSGQVLDSSITDTPKPATEAWEHAYDMNYEESVCRNVTGTTRYNVDNECFNIRDLDNDLNMDCMSYANFHLANRDAKIPLDADVLLKHSQRTFQTFFQHFATSANCNSHSTIYERADPNHAEKVNVTLSNRIRVLGMNETATWLSLAIILILGIIVIIFMISLELVYPR